MCKTQGLKEPQYRVVDEEETRDEGNCQLAKSLTV